MPVEKELTKLIPKIHKYHYENLGLFFFVKGQLKILPTMTLEQAILDYFRFAGISVDEWDIDSAKTTFNRMQHDFYDCKR
jgi:hypothetical protein